MNTPLKFSDEFISELQRERRKLNFMINSVSPFRHPLEYSLEEVVQMKQSYNAIIRLLYLAGKMDEKSYKQDLYVCAEVS